MSKYTIMLKVLDNICNTAPENFKSYHLEKKTEQEIDSIRSKAYIHLFLLVKFGIIDFKTRHDYITDGSADGGLDAYYIDEEQKIIYMIQSKFRANSTNFIIIVLKRISFASTILLGIYDTNTQSVPSTSLNTVILPSIVAKS